MNEEFTNFLSENQNINADCCEKQINPELWQPVGFKQVDYQKNYRIQETHSFLGTQGRDLYTGQILYGFGETPREHADKQ